MDGQAIPKKEEIFQEIRILNSPKPDVPACKRLLLKLLTMLNRGTELSEEESNTVFFGLTFLFRETDQPLKKIIYLTLNEMVHQPSFYMITNSLLKDAKEKNTYNKIDAFKLIPYVINQNNPVQSEQLFKTAIFDKNIAVANAAVMAANWISLHEPDHIKKCVNDIQDLLLSKPSACHYHAVNVLYNIKKNDMMSFIKIVLQIINKNSSYSILTTMQLIRYCREVIESDILDNNSERAIFSWLAKQLSKNNTIVIEVAKTMVAMKNISNNELIAVVSSLSLYLLSMSPINVYSALKILDKMLENPAKAALLSNTSDIESLLSNSNKAVKSLALSILLKVSREDKIVELLDKTYEIFSELPDSIKIGVISSCEDISRKYPEKTKDIIFFLCRCIRDRGELEFKIKAIKRVTKMMKKRKEFYDKVFDFFCEYIEDPYSPKLVLIILNIFVENIEHCSDPRKCLRFILNRLHLDESKIRSAAITCLGEIGKKIPGVREECFSIVSCYVKDIDDEVRERAFYYSNLIDERPAFVESYNEEVFQLEVLENIQSMIRQSLSSDSPFDLDDIIAKREPLTPGGGHVKPSQPSALAPQYAESPTRGAANPLEGRPDKNMLAFIKDHEDYAEYGELKLSRPAVDVSFKESEVYVTVAKHFFEEHIVLEYTIKNQDEMHDLVGVSVNNTIDKEDLQVCHMVENTKIANGTEGKVFVSLQKNPETPIVAAEIKSALEFKAQYVEDGEVTNEYNDEFNCEDLSDYMTKMDLRKGEFKERWDSFGVEEVTQNYKLDYKTVESAVVQTIKHFGMSVCENSDNLVPSSNYHTLYLNGAFLGEEPVMLIGLIGIEAGRGCVLKLRVKTNIENLTTNIVDSIS